MSLPIREHIIVAVVTAYGTILGPNAPGAYQSHVKKVFRGAQVPQNLKEFPCVAVIDRGDLPKRHIKLTREAHLVLDVRGYAHEYGHDLKHRELSILMADLEKKSHEDETWGGLAVETNVTTNLASASEAGQPLGADIMTLDILYRTERGNPYVVQNFNTP